MKYSGHRELLCELSKLSKLNAFDLLGYQTNTDASILVYKFSPERTGFNMYAEYTRPQLTFLALVPWLGLALLYNYKSLHFTLNVKVPFVFLSSNIPIYKQFFYFSYL